MTGLTEVGPNVDYEPYIDSLLDLTRDVLSDKESGRRLDYHRGQGWDLVDRIESDLEEVTANGQGWSINFRGALDTLAERQFQSGKYSIRENIQNARDAKPKTGIYLSPFGEPSKRPSSINEKSTLKHSYYVVEDGDGMDVNDIGQYLFNIFSSSKKGDVNAAGEHGIGFISNLANSEGVVIDTKKEGGQALTVVIKGKNKGEEKREDRYEIHVFEGRRQAAGTTIACLNFDTGDKWVDFDNYLKNAVSEFAKFIDVPLYLHSLYETHGYDIDDGTKKFKKHNKSLDSIEVQNKHTIETPEIRRGVIGISEKTFNQKLDIMQNGITISSLRISNLEGAVDAVNVVPIIGRAGLVDDDNYKRFMADLFSHITELADYCAKKPELTEDERDFLLGYLSLFARNGSQFPDACINIEKVPESIKAAKIIKTPFNASIKALDERIGLLTPDEKQQYKNLLERHDGSCLYVSLDNILKSAEQDKFVYVAGESSSSAEELRKRGFLVLDESYEIDQILHEFIPDYHKIKRSVDDAETDHTQFVRCQLDYTKKSFLETISAISNCEVVLAEFQSPEKEPLKDRIACNVSRLDRETDELIDTTTYVNMACPINQKLLAAFSRDPEDQLVRFAIQSLAMPTVAHEETHSFGFKGHGNEFYVTNDSLVQYHQHTLAEQLEKMLSERSSTVKLAEVNSNLEILLDHTRGELDKTKADNARLEKLLQHYETLIEQQKELLDRALGKKK